MSADIKDYIERINFTRLSKFGDVEHKKTGRRTNMTVSVRDGYPGFSVWLNVDPSATGVDNLIRAPFSYWSFMTVPQILELILDKPNGTTRVLECLNTGWDKETGKRTEEKHLSAGVVFGKDKEGVIYIGFTAPDRPSVKFDFLYDSFFNYNKHENGTSTPVDKEEESRIVTKGWITLFNNVVASGASDYSFKFDTRKETK